MSDQAAGYFWAEKVQDEDLWDDYFKKFPLQLRDPSIMYNRILSLFARHTRIPSPFTHFGEKVVWYIWEKRGVYP